MSSVPLAPDDSSLPKSSRLWWLVPAVGLVLLTLVALLASTRPDKLNYGTSYDASGSGFRGVYLVLEDLGFRVERSRKAVGGDVRWILYPTKVGAREVGAIDAWVRGGGRVLLAVDEVEFADQFGLAVMVDNGQAGKKDLSPATIDRDEMGLPVQIQSAPPREAGKPFPAESADVSEVYAGPTIVTGPAGGRVWGKIGGKPMVTVYQRGQGEIWLLNRPDVLTNANVRAGDNAILACRLAEAMLADRRGERLAFDEFCHGLRDRPDVFQLLLRPPVRAVTLEALLLTGLVVWHFAIRFGTLRHRPPPPRRSKEEFLNAMADLLTRKGDRADAFRTVRDDFVRRLEADLGLPAGTPVEHTVREAAHRRGLPEEPLRTILAADEPPEGASAKSFLAILHQLAALDRDRARPKPTGSIPSSSRTTPT
jgi:hypothetical protein